MGEAKRRKKPSKEAPGRLRPWTRTWANGWAPLDSDNAVTALLGDVYALAIGEPYPEDWPDSLVYVPRFPRDAAEARDMLNMRTIVITQPIPRDRDPNLRTYLGYTDDELRRGRPALTWDGD